MTERMGEQEVKKHRTSSVTKQEVHVHIAATLDQVAPAIKRMSKTHAALRAVHSVDVTPMLAEIAKAKKDLVSIQNNLNTCKTHLELGRVYLEEALALSTQGLAQYWSVIHAAKPWVLQEKFKIGEIKDILATYYACVQPGPARGSPAQ